MVNFKSKVKRYKKLLLRRKGHGMFQRHHKHLSINQQDLSEARFRRFLKEFSVYEQKVAFEDTLNTFLDLYSAWMKTHEPWLKIRLVMLAFELHRIDPAFECNLSFTD